MDDFGKKTTIVVLGCLFWSVVLYVGLLVGLFLAFTLSRGDVSLPADVDVVQPF